MISLPVELALGTVQFGVNYGVVGRGEVVPIKEVRQILACASKLGIRMLDTAPAYGAIEAKLTSLFDKCQFQVISKIPTIPKGIDNKAAIEFVVNAIAKTRKHLGDSLSTLLFHCCEDLQGERGKLIWQTAIQETSNINIRLGVSCYSPDELYRLSCLFPIKVAQLPGNALDQRLRSSEVLRDIEIHLRSIFLQGTLLNDPKVVAGRLPRPLIDALHKWQTWCRHQNISIMQGALSVVKNLPGVRYCVVGVDSVAQLEEIYEAWSNTKSLVELPPRVDSPEIVDPRYWFN